MLPEQKNLAIYLAEREEVPVRSDDDFVFHSFLLLIDESMRPVSILQQLHFTDAEDPYTKELYLLPNARLGVSQDRVLDRVYAYPIIGGREYDVLEMWNYALSYASYVKVMKPEFSLDYIDNPEAVNCRAGLMATLQALGIDIGHDLFKQKGGTECRELPLGAVFEHNSKKQNTRTLAELWQSNEGLRATLDASWIPRERYVGPVKRPFHLMDRDAVVCDQSFE